MGLAFFASKLQIDDYNTMIVQPLAYFVSLSFCK